MPDDTTAGTHGPARSRRPRRARKLQRAAHLVAALPVLAYVYLTPAADAALTSVVRGVVVPVLVLSGLLLWQAPRLRRLRARRGRAVAV
jgi:hypothetical protein